MFFWQLLQCSAVLVSRRRQGERTRGGGGGRGSKEGAPPREAVGRKRSRPRGPRYRREEISKPARGPRYRIERDFEASARTETSKRRDLEARSLATIGKKKKEKKRKNRSQHETDLVDVVIPEIVETSLPPRNSLDVSPSPQDPRCSGLLRSAAAAVAAVRGP